MKKIISFSCLLFGLLGSATVLAGATDPLFINLTSNDGHRATMAIALGVTQQAKGHPLTIFLNDKGVLVGSRRHAKQYARQQSDLLGAMQAGATIFVCPVCLLHNKINEADLLPGIKLASPELTSEALFKDNTKTLTW
jgi:predicted peroxiredoxin